MYYRPDSTAESRPKQMEQASYYEKIIRNIYIVLQTDQVAHIHEGLLQVPSPRYISTLVVNMIILGKTIVRTTSAPGVDQDLMLHTCAEHCWTWETTLSVFTVRVHSTPWVITPVSPMTTGRNPGLHHKILTVMDQIREWILKIQDYHEEIKHNLQIYPMADHTPEDNIQDHKVETDGKIIQIIQMVLFLTETTGMTRTELDIKRPDSMRDTTSSILQITIITHTNHPSSFCYRTQSQHYIDWFGQYPVQISRYRIGKPEKSTRCL